MNFTLPADTGAQLASTTTSIVVAYAAPAELIGGVLLAFLVLELIIDAVRSSKSSTQDRELG